VAQNRKEANFGTFPASQVSQAPAFLQREEKRYAIRNSSGNKGVVTFPKRCEIGGLCLLEVWKWRVIGMIFHVLTLAHLVHNRSRDAEY